MEHDTAGDPVSGIKWTRRTTEKVADELASAGIEVCPNTVGKLLKGLGYRLRSTSQPTTNPVPSARLTRSRSSKSSIGSLPGGCTAS